MSMSALNKMSDRDKSLIFLSVFAVLAVAGSMLVTVERQFREKPSHEAGLVAVAQVEETVPRLSRCEKRIFDGLWVGYRSDAMKDREYSFGDEVTSATIQAGDVAYSVTASRTSGYPQLFVHPEGDYKRAILDLNDFFGFTDGVCEEWANEPSN